MIEFIVSTKKEPKSKVSYEMGDIFYHNSGTPYILANVGEGVSLISLKDGNRWGDPENTRSSIKITEEEFKQVCGSDFAGFKKVKSAKMEVEL